MLRRVLILALLGGLAIASSAQAQFGRVLLMPGVTYERQVQFTSNGPVAIHVLNGPRPEGAWSLRPALSNGTLLGREKVTAMQAALSPQVTVAGVNGDLFAAATGRPSGILMQAGVLAHPPLTDRSSIGISTDGTLNVGRVRMFGRWKGTGQRRPLTLNQQPGPNGVALYTPAWGPTTPPLQNVVEAVLQPFPALIPNADVTAPLLQMTQTNGGTTIPPDGAVLVARGAGTQRLADEAPGGSTVTVRFQLDPDWTGIVDAIGGGPVLVRDGRPVFRHTELFTTAQLARNPRTAIGQLADGRIILVVVDGRQPGYSVGMTNFELAQTLVRLGAVAGAGLDAGGSSTMAFEGSLLNRPSDAAGERAVSEGLFFLYSGVYAPPPSEAVVSPNGDAVGESQIVSYKLVKPATVTASLVGPDGAPRAVDAGPKEPGLYRFSWAGTTAEGTPEPEGRWRFTVTAVEAEGQSTTADRFFVLNRTLGGLAITPPLLVLPPEGALLRATFTLTRPATVHATVETPAGVVLAVAARVPLAPGTQTLAWNGKVGVRAANTGRYVFRVAAVNELGRTELTQPFTARRVAVAAQSKAKQRVSGR